MGIKYICQLQRELVGDKWDQVLLSTAKRIGGRFGRGSRMSVNCKKELVGDGVGIKYVCKLQRDAVGDRDGHQVYLSAAKRIGGRWGWVYS